MTVDLALKVEDRALRTILDLGSSTDHCLVLRTDAAGKPELVATVGGKVVARATATKPLTPGAWTRLRVESDGKSLSLWVDGVKAAAQATTFRPCDVFPPGATKRNFLAVSRDASNRFKGVIDYVVFYHSVSGDFSKVLRRSATHPRDRRRNTSPLSRSPTATSPNWVRRLRMRSDGGLLPIPSSARKPTHASVNYSSARPHTSRPRRS